MWIVRPSIAAHRVLVEARLVQRVGVDLDLHVELVAGAQRRLDHRRHRAPVLVDLQTDARPPRPARAAARRRSALPLPRKPKLIGHASAACSMRPRLTVPDERDPDGDRPEPAAEHRGHARRDRFLAQARRVEVDVHVDRRRPSRSCPRPSARRCSRRSTMPGVTPSIDLRVPGLAHADDAAVLDADVALDDPEHGVDHARRW